MVIETLVFAVLVFVMASSAPRRRLPFFVYGEWQLL